MSSKLLINILCLTLLSVSALATFLAYQKLEREISGGESLLPNLQLGKTSYSLLINGKCFGSVSSELKIEDGFLLQMSGHFLLAVESESVPVNLKLDAQFNTLGQAGITSLKIEAQDRFIALNTKGTNPIEIELRSFGAQAGLAFKQRIKGPILLRQLADGDFTLEYSRADQALGSQNPLFAHNIFQTLRPEIIENSATKPAQCNPEQLEPLEVGAYLKMAQNLVQSLQFLRGQ